MSTDRPLDPATIEHEPTRRIAEALLASGLRMYRRGAAYRVVGEGVDVVTNELGAQMHGEYIAPERFIHPQHRRIAEALHAGLDGGCCGN